MPAGFANQQDTSSPASSASVVHCAALCRIGLRKSSSHSAPALTQQHKEAGCCYPQSRRKSGPFHSAKVVSPTVIDLKCIVEA